MTQEKVFVEGTQEDPYLLQKMEGLNTFLHNIYMDYKLHNVYIYILRFSQIGVASWALLNCGVPGSLGVFTRVSEYKEWIKSVATGTQDSNC